MDSHIALPTGTAPESVIIGWSSGVMSLLVASRDGLSEEDLLVLLSRRKHGPAQVLADDNRPGWARLAMVEKPDGKFNDFLAVNRAETRFGVFLNCV